MKRAIIVHCWEGQPEYAWYPWAKAELEHHGYQVTVPAMPDTIQPRQYTWVPYLQYLIGAPNEDLVLIGHSIGCAAILRYLETLPGDQKVGRVVLVAAFTDDLNTKELETFFVEPFQLDRIRIKAARGFAIIQSDNDPWAAASYGPQLRDALAGKLIIKHAAGHMSQDDGCRQLPEVVEQAVVD